MTDKIFCVAPFVESFISTQGYTKLCCVSKQINHQDFGQFDWYNDQLTETRRLFNQGKWPQECVNCRIAEAQGGRSTRQSFNQRFSDHYRELMANPTDRPPPAHSYQIRMGNRCNLRCVMCDSESSDMIGRAQQIYQNDTGITPPDPIWPPHSVDQETATIDQILGHAEHIQQLELNGGEPFIMPNVIHCLNQLVTQGHADHIDLSITTNGTVLRPQWVTEWLNRFRSVLIQLSVDAVESRAEYVRYGHRWHTITRRIQDFRSAITADSAIELLVTPTVHAATVSEIPRVWAWCHAMGLGVPCYHPVYSPEWLHPGRVPHSVSLPVKAWIDQLTEDQLTQSGLDSVREVMEHPPQPTTWIIQEQQYVIGMLNHTLPVTWRDAVPELADWDPHGEPPPQ